MKLPFARAALTTALVFLCSAGAAPPPLPLPEWVDHAGAARVPGGAAVVSVNAFGAAPDGSRPCTGSIQMAIDACAAAGGGTVTFQPGRYLSGSVFLKSHVHLRIDAGVTLLGSTDPAAYPVQPTRIAGIEMAWPAGLVNVDGQQDVEISGPGTIDGQGENAWKRYWDLRKAYVPRGLRWAADYDCQRPRLVVIWKSGDVTLSGLRLRRSGFWTVQVTYCDRVTVDGVAIADNKGPSTDGVDIDSSRRVLVQNCDIDNNDDDICLKSGRDSDGLRVNRPTEYVVIRDNTCRHGGGVISFGSETSGGIRHVVAYRNRGIGTSEGLRFKSARTRGGTIEDVLIRDTTLIDVPLPFTFTLNWNPQFSYATIPAAMKEVPEYWKVMAAPVTPPERGYATFRDITIAHVTCTGARRILSAAGMAERPLGPVHWEDVQAAGADAGSVEDARDWTMKDVRFTTADGAPVRLARCENVGAPDVTRAPAALP